MSNSNAGVAEVSDPDNFLDLDSMFDDGSQVQEEHDQDIFFPNSDIDGAEKTEAPVAAQNMEGPAASEPPPLLEEEVEVSSVLFDQAAQEPQSETGIPQPTSANRQAQTSLADEVAPKSKSSSTGLLKVSLVAAAIAVAGAGGYAVYQGGLLDNLNRSDTAEAEVVAVSEQSTALDVTGVSVPENSIEESFIPVDSSTGQISDEELLASSFEAAFVEDEPVKQTSSDLTPAVAPLSAADLEAFKADTNQSIARLSAVIEERLNASSGSNIEQVASNAEAISRLHEQQSIQRKATIELGETQVAIATELREIRAEQAKLYAKLEKGLELEKSQLNTVRSELANSQPAISKRPATAINPKKSKSAEPKEVSEPLVSVSEPKIDNYNVASNWRVTAIVEGGAVIVNNKGQKMVVHRGSDYKLHGRLFKVDVTERKVYFNKSGKIWQVGGAQ